MKHSIQLLAAVAVATFAGCGGSGSSGPGNLAPTVSNTSVSPGLLTFAGGAVLIETDATDDRSVASVSAQVSGPGVSEVVSLSGARGHYAGTYVAPGNASPTGAIYSVSVTASDAAGLVSDPETVSFTVRAAAVPPAPPPGL